MSFEADHADLVDVFDEAVAVTFTRKTQASFDPLTETATPADTTVAGKAYRVRANSLADQEAYRGLGLVESLSPCIWFRPTTYGQVPSVGDTAVWAGLTYRVARVDAVAPDGNVIAAKVILAR